MYPMQAYPQLTYTEPVFTVRVTKHTGALLLWVDQTTTVTGTYQRCEAAIREAQIHCLLAGWWSPLSAVLLNWFALLANWAARRTLSNHAARARAMAAHPSAQSRQPYPPAPYPGTWPAHAHHQVRAPQPAGYWA